MEPAYRGLGRCICCFWLAVAFDVVGLLVLLIGVFVNVFFYDLLIYAGAIVIFLSLVWWVFWYSGNIEVLASELEDDVGLTKKDKSGIGGAVRRLSNRLAGSIRNSLRRNGGVAAGSLGRQGGERGSAADAAVAPHLEQVVVALATLKPIDRTLQKYDAEMPTTATETSPT
ncbi:transmembrane protein 238-like [Corythoichthys intestinalis]|uniref:transmembrane protein 238-like n=1 Tax=Corythoichthys intestinalis TaxID=161448 RepID=UPI0025A5118F|nr:transmembrane protein 238-like [Corythoichthys intestinalis]XP_061805595.1 transmembrane protein 238-like [Nerophis lumbriciformis]